MLFGPVFDLKLFWLYGLVFRRRFVVLMAIGLFALIAFICWLWAGMESGAGRPGVPLGTLICLPGQTLLHC
jgi:hypothetical protein